MHEGRRKGLFDIDRSYFVLFALLTCFGVDDFDVEARHGFAGRSWFLKKSFFESEVVGENRSSSLSLPVAVVNKLAFEMVLDPLESRHVASLANKGNAS